MKECPIAYKKLKGYKTIQEAEDKKAITSGEAHQLGFMVAYGKVGNVYPLIK